MFIGVSSLIVIYICMGFYMMGICAESRVFSNPLWYGFVIILWPIFVILGLLVLIKEWIESVIKYYKKKGEKK